MNCYPLKINVLSEDMLERDQKILALSEEVIMKTIVCFKLVPEEQDISVNADRSLNLTTAAPKISQFDLNAIEAASELVAMAAGGEVVALSVGGEYLNNTKVRKDVLSRGPDSLALVVDEQFHQISAYQTAQILSHSVLKIGFDVIICGDGSGDRYAQQVGMLLGEMLNLPTINAVSKIISATDGLLTVERTSEDEIEILEMPLPAVISVTTDINIPRIPTMKAILGAGKKPTTTYSREEIGLSALAELTCISSIAAPEQTSRKNIIIEGDSEEQIATFITHLKTALI